MPVMNGFEATTAIMNMIKEGTIPNVPVIALTAYSDEKTKKKCYEVGMKGVLTKPIVASQLFAILKKERVRKGSTDSN